MRDRHTATVAQTGLLDDTFVPVNLLVEIVGTGV